MVDYTKLPRHQLILGKKQVVQVKEHATGKDITLNIGNSVFVTIHNAPLTSDVREGDLLTLYTEVLINAQPSQPSE